MVAILDQPRPLYAGLRISPDAYFSLEDDGFKYDMIDGVLHLPPSGTPEHGKSHFAFSTVLGMYLETHAVGEAMLETDIKLPDGGDILRPDVSLVLRENAHIIQKKGIFGTPNLVCEVLSPSNRKRDLTIKSERYLKNGVTEYWIVDPAERAIEVRHNNGKDWEILRGRTLKSRVLPGFVVSTAKIFRKR